MLKDIADLLQCKAIYMLQGWQESKGACIEHYIATQIGIPITYEIEQPINESE
nr:MAG TPA: Blasticidin M [Caudoviricetes sp.]